MSKDTEDRPDIDNPLAPHFEGDLVQEALEQAYETGAVEHECPNCQKDIPVYEDSEGFTKCIYCKVSLSWNADEEQVEIAGD